MSCKCHKCELFYGFELVLGFIRAWRSAGKGFEGKEKLDEVASLLCCVFGELERKILGS
jgi:hypothetical protein